MKPKEKHRRCGAARKRMRTIGRIERKIHLVVTNTIKVGCGKGDTHLEIHRKNYTAYKSRQQEIYRPAQLVILSIVGQIRIDAVVLKRKLKRTTSDRVQNGDYELTGRKKNQKNHYLKKMKKKMCPLTNNNPDRLAVVLRPQHPRQLRLCARLANASRCQNINVRQPKTIEKKPYKQTQY